ncbi:hypothetical protein BpHYR1_009677 [Brachionus plicatilis]|uniref:Uncharacterized protein n=1 Tax=Brachionus plicatilis TaxID=10195 RepID=A0A3M7T924_BRAPC|nr:hypothetical protein BpHYR1_009677 [Brachionus plicatilis]
MRKNNPFHQDNLVLIILFKQYCLIKGNNFEYLIFYSVYFGFFLKRLMKFCNLKIFSHYLFWSGESNESEADLFKHSVCTSVCSTLMSSLLDSGSSFMLPILVHDSSCRTRSRSCSRSRSRSRSRSQLSMNSFNN